MKMTKTEVWQILTQNTKTRALHELLIYPTCRVSQIRSHTCVIWSYKEAEEGRKNYSAHVMMTVLVVPECVCYEDLGPLGCV